MSDIYIKSHYHEGYKTIISPGGYKTKTRNKNCLYCGKEFEGPLRKLCCSRYCTYRNQTRGKTHAGTYRQKKECVCTICGKIYIGSGLSSVCGTTCRERKAIGIEKKEVKCVVCGSEFTTFGNRTKMCSPKCQIARRTSQARQYMRNARKGLEG